MSDLRDAVVSAARALGPLGLSAGMSGNVSVREGAAMLITPSAVPYDEMTPERLVSVDIATGEPSGGKPSSEWRFHRDILAARPEVGAVVHAHPRHATALAMCRRDIPACHYMVAMFGGGDVRCSGYATFGTQALSDAALTALADRTACLLANHGVIVLGGGLDQAMHRAVELEALAAQYVAALAVGDLALLTEAEIAEALAAFAGYGR